MIQIDFETLCVKPSAVLVNMAMVHFPDVDDDEGWKVILEGGGFKYLIENNSKLIKFDIPSQRSTRTTNQDTINFWKKQPEIARSQLKRTDQDLTLLEALPEIELFFKENFDAKNDLLYSRGNAFDIGIIDNYLSEVGYDSFGLFRFWNVRDVRTDIGSTLMNRKMDKCHLHKDVLEGFIHHNPIHDCCKDIMMMYYAQQYTIGKVEYPTIEESHEVTIDRKR